MTRNGKIARLPRVIRDQLNQRLEDGEVGARLVEWLNELPEVQQVLEREFSGRPINEQNLSEWRQGGYHDWLRHQESLSLVRQLADEAADLKAEAGHHSIADHVSASLGVALAQCARQAAAEGKDDPKQRRELLAVAQEVAKIRRGDHEQERIRLEAERWKVEHDKIAAKEASRKTLAPFWDLLLAREFTNVFKDEIENGDRPVAPDLQSFLARIGATRGAVRDSSLNIQWPSIPNGDQTKSK